MWLDLLGLRAKLDQQPETSKTMCTQTSRLLAGHDGLLPRLPGPLKALEPKAGELAGCVSAICCHLKVPMVPLACLSSLCPGTLRHPASMSACPGRMEQKAQHSNQNLHRCQGVSLGPVPAHRHSGLGPQVEPPPG